MRAYIGKKGLKKTFQDDFPETTDCIYCKAEARIAFVVREDDNPKEYVCSLHKNIPYGSRSMWPHDAIAAATYICKKCMKPTTIMNQG